MGTPTEVYVHGVSYLCIGFGVIIVGFVTSGIYLPIFHELRLTSTYEYLEKRFDRKIRTLGSVLFLIGIVSYSSSISFIYSFKFSMRKISYSFLDDMASYCYLRTSVGF